MANFVNCGDYLKIEIPSWKDVDKCTFYRIQINAGEINWQVERRYSEFVKLHENLVANHGVTTDILPPKKVIGNRGEAFIETRKQGLQAYLSTVVRFLQKTMPKSLATFLRFNDFDIWFIVKQLAVQFFEQGEAILSKTRSYKFTPLQLYAIAERLKQPCSSLDLLDQREDFSHVVDFSCQLKEITITGSDSPITDSNIVPNTLPINLSVFKNLENLILKSVNCAKIIDLGSLRLTLKHLVLDSCVLSNLQDMFLCDQVHKNNFDASNEWKQLTRLLVWQTTLEIIDLSAKLMPNLKILALEDNRLKELNNLEYQTNLVHLNARNNRLNLAPNFEFKTRHLTVLILSQNGIDTLAPFSKLTRLETLDLQSNRISDVTEIRHIASLPCLENIVLSGNPVSIIVDYRVTVLEYFGNRAYRICLDNESTHQKELDKVAILRALRVSREKQSFMRSPP